MTTIGYARVSTDGQTLDAQQTALRVAGAAKVYSEKISGAVTDRPALAKALAALGNGDRQPSPPANTSGEGRRPPTGEGGGTDRRTADPL